ncbi:MAG: sporulation membrane protein YtrI [Bacilli bacterium]
MLPFNWLREKSIRLIAVGFTFGAIFAWLVFLYMYGEIQNIQSRKLHERETDMAQLNERIKLLQADHDRLNEANRRQLSIQEIDVTLVVNRPLSLSSTTQIAFRTSIEKTLSHLITQPISTVSSQSTLLIQSIENQTYRVDDRFYKLVVRQLVFDQTLSIVVEVLPRRL